MKHRRFPTLAAIATLALAGLARAAPDVAGTWDMKPERGENLGMVAAVQQTLVVTQTEAAVTLDYTNVFRGETTTRQVKLDLSGAATENFAAMGDPSTTESSWDGDRLVTKWTTAGAIPGTEVIRMETLAVSADGAELSITTERANRPTMKVVYQKRQ
jgi:hypothetical protein